MNEARTFGDSRTQADVGDDLMDVARLAYIYGFAPYEMTRLRTQAFAQPRSGKPARPNALLHGRALTTPTTGRVTNTNADMLKSSAWLDLSRGPLAIHTPDAANRYYSLALMDVFTNNFAVLGRRATGGAAADFWLAGPQWAGAAPAGMTTIRAPTNAVWALLRIMIDGPDELPAVHALQDQFSISAPPGRSSQTPPEGQDPATPPPALFDSGKPLTFFDVLNAVLTENPPPARDQAVLDRLRAIGVGPSLRFRRQDFTSAQLDALRQGLASARDEIRGRAGAPPHGASRGGPAHWPSDALLARLRGAASAPPTGRRAGWSRPAAAVGNFGADYLLRARCALRGIGGLPCEEAMYFIAATDAVGDPLNGRHNYVLQFPPAGEPPVDAYWSLTAYWSDEDNRRWLTPNEINRYSIGNLTPGLRHGADGSLEISIQRDRPSAGDENWLPAPDGRFVLNLRAYQPRLELRDGRYAIPEVRRRSMSE